MKGHLCSTPPYATRGSRIEIEDFLDVKLVTNWQSNDYIFLYRLSNRGSGVFIHRTRRVLNKARLFLPLDITTDLVTQVYPKGIAVEY